MEARKWEEQVAQSREVRNESPGSGGRQTWTQVSTLPLFSCVTLARSSKSSFLTFKIEKSKYQPKRWSQDNAHNVHRIECQHWMLSSKCTQHILSIIALSIIKVIAEESWKIIQNDVWKPSDLARGRSLAFLARIISVAVWEQRSRSQFTMGGGVGRSQESKYRKWRFLF